MTPNELAKKLSDMYAMGAKYGETATMVHLFGIKYAAQIEKCGVSPANIASMAQIPVTYGTEINKGKNLSKYVRVKEYT